jgi:hypothetical protein
MMCGRKTGVLIVSLMNLYACNPWHITMRVNPKLTQKPLVETIPLTIGVYKNPAFIHRIDDLSPLYGNTFTYPIGEPSSALFDQVLAALFKSVIPVVERPQTALAIRPKIDGVIEIDIASFNCSFAPQDNSVRTANIVYRITFYDFDGRQLGSHFVAGNGKKNIQMCLSCDDSEETEMAMLDAMARFMTEFRSWPEIKLWLGAHGVKAEDN